MIKEYMVYDTELNIEGIRWNTWTAFSWVILEACNGTF
jgi:hypothetical protein